MRRAAIVFSSSLQAGLRAAISSLRALAKMAGGAILKRPAARNATLEPAAKRKPAVDEACLYRNCDDESVLVAGCSRLILGKRSMFFK